MKAAIINPYLDTLGGGERYTLAVATSLLKQGVSVDIQWKDISIGPRLENRFGIKMKGISFVEDVKKGEGYDYCFWVSDGSIPLMHARNNFLHFQVPFKNVNGRSLINKLKLYRVKRIIVNSEFTKNVIDEEFGLDSKVIYPPVDVVSIKPKRKEDIILYVGRFSQLKQAKRQDVLIDSFIRLVKKGYDKWQLVLIGGVEIGSGDYVKILREKAQGYPVKFMESPSFSQVKELYGKSKVFWSASGYDIDENKEPEKVEHFGITVVEAMSAKCVPIIFAAGGHKEIVKDETNGYLWTKKSELVNITSSLIDDPRRLNMIANEGLKSSSLYGYERFENEILQTFLSY